MRESFPAARLPEEKENNQAETEPVDSDLPESASRRDFLKGVAAGALISLTPAAPFLVSEGRKLYGETIDREHLEEELKGLRERLRVERGVEIDFSPIFPLESEEGLKSEPLETLIEKRDVCEACIQAFDLYPPFLHVQAGLSVIRVMNDLKIHEGGKEEKDLDIAGIALRDIGVMHIEYAEMHPEVSNYDEWAYSKMEKFFPASSEEKQARIRATFHHELEHFVEDGDGVDEELYSKTTRGFWYGDGKLPTSLYDNEVDYLVKRKTMTPERAKQLKKNYAGFARRYGKTNFHEDRATVVEALMESSESHAELQERAKTDETLKNKIAFMKKFYFKKSFGLMSETYWNLLAQPSVDHAVVAEHLKIRARSLGQMSDKAFALYMKDTVDEELSPVVLEEWKRTLNEWGEEENENLPVDQ